MHGRRMGERVWALKLMLGHACGRASLQLGARLSGLFPGTLQQCVAERVFAGLGPTLQARRFNRMRTLLRASGCTPMEATRWTARTLARDWLRQVHRQRLQRLPFAELQRHLRSMAWHDPFHLWPAAAGRRCVVCLLPSGDAELGLAAALDRPGAPAHFFVQCPHREQSHQYRTLQALQRGGHRLDVDRSGRHGSAWRQLQRGATVFTVLTAEALASGGRLPGPLRLARRAGVPVLLLGHRSDVPDAGTLHVLGEFAGTALEGGAPRLLDSARRFLQAGAVDCSAAVR